MTGLIDYLMQTKWALRETELRQLANLVERHSSGAKLAEDEVERIVAARKKRDAEDVERPLEVRGSVGVIPISGVIAKHSSQVGGVSQPRGTSVERIREGLRAALADDRVETILMAIDSPGGSVDGLIDIADELRAARAVKPLLAYTDGLMASAAYWIGSQASAIYATRGAELGSIGVYMPVTDTSRATENAGVQVRMFRSGPHKGAGMRGTRLTEEQAQEIQGEIDRIAEDFVLAVAEGRGMELESVEGLADGKTFAASRAVEVGLADELLAPGSDLESLVARLNGGSQSARAATGYSQVEGGIVSDSNVAITLSANSFDGREPVAGTETAPMPDSPKPEDIRASAIEEERARCASILAHADPEQHQLATELIENGATESDAFKALLTDVRERAATRIEAAPPVDDKAARLAEIRGSSKPVGQYAEVTDAPSEPEKPKSAEEHWKQIQAQGRAGEFLSSFETFKWCLKNGEVD